MSPRWAPVSPSREFWNLGTSDISAPFLCCLPYETIRHVTLQTTACYCHFPGPPFSLTHKAGVQENVPLEFDSTPCMPLWVTHGVLGELNRW